jgi:hypothetical protein
VGDHEVSDLGDGIPSILFVGGIHSREWLATESLIELARNLIAGAQNRGTPEYALLRRVAVWIIPMVNVAGRIIDDTRGGDPEDFYRGDGNSEHGWRHSADLRGCEAGTDIARNFSTDWVGVTDGTCGWNHHFKGLAPFSTMEANALKAFVQNHWICMAVDVHTKSQRIWNTWGTADTAGVKMKRKAVEIWDLGLGILGQKIYDPPAPDSSSWDLFFYGLRIVDFVTRFSLDTGYRTGTEDGQFTAWLQADQHIPSVIIELPPNNSRRSTDYYSSEFRFQTGDLSNTFHPSSARVTNLLQDAFVPMAKYLIAQADAPGSATTTGFVDDDGTAVAWDTSDPDGSPKRDFGILAAKIGFGDPGAPGELVSLPASLGFQPQPDPGFWYAYPDRPAFDWLYPYDAYTLHYWVQNYSRLNTRLSRRCTVTVELKSQPSDSTDSDPWRVDISDMRRFSLKPREKIMDRLAFELELDRDYELHLRVRRGWRRPKTDDFSPNDEKVFRFTTRWRG